MGSIPDKFQWHDFRRPCHNFVTLKVVDFPRNRLAYVNDDGVRLTPLGLLVEKHWRQIENETKGLLVTRAFQIMPDHLHGLIDTIALLPRPFGQIICQLKARVTYHARRDLGFPAKAPVWEGGCHWKMLAKAHEIAAAITYIEDNPRVCREKQRAATSYGKVAPIEHRRLPETWPDAPNDRWRLSWRALGNTALLDGDIWALRVSRRATAEEIVTSKEEALGRARKNAICISPAFSPGEREVFRAVVAAGGKAIHLPNDSLTVRYHPAGWAMESLKEGRFLVLSAIPEDRRHTELSRILALHLNACAKAIAEHR